MKRYTLNLFIMIVILIAMFNVFAVSSNALGTETNFVYDNANILSFSEEVLLQNEAEKYYANGISVVFVTTDRNPNSAQIYANNFYDSHDFYDDGILFLIDLDTREVYIDTVGKYVELFNDKRIEKCLDAGFEYIYSDYYQVFKSMLDYSKPFLNGKGMFWLALKESLSFDLTSLIIIIATVVIATLMLKVKHNKNNHPTAGQRYFNANGFKIKNREDRYIGTRTSVAYGYYNSSSSGSRGGGRSGGRSSGGRSHGGGGRKF